MLRFLNFSSETEHVLAMFLYRNIPNISPGLIEVRKHFLVGLYSGGLYTEGFIFGRAFGLKGDLCMPKNSAFGAQSERLIITFSA